MPAARGGAGAGLRARRGRWHRRRGPSKTSAAPASAICWRSPGRTSRCWRCWRCRSSPLLGMPLRARLLWVLGLIAVYVPLAGAGPSIQRAGVMGALSVLGDAGAGAAPRASTRWRVAAIGHPRDRPRRRRRRRLAAQLRRRARHPLRSPRRLPPRSRRRAYRLRGPLGARPGRGRGDDGRRDAGDRAADRLPLRRTLDRRPCSPTCSPCRRWRRRCGWGCSPRSAGRFPASRSRRSTRSPRCCSPTSPRSRPGARGRAGPASQVRLGLGGLVALLRGDRRGRHRLPMLLRRRRRDRRARRPPAAVDGWDGAAAAGAAARRARPRGGRRRRRRGWRGRRPPAGLRVIGPRRRPG